MQRPAAVTTECLYRWKRLVTLFEERIQSRRLCDAQPNPDTAKRAANNSIHHVIFVHSNSPITKFIAENVWGNENRHSKENKTPKTLLMASKQSCGAGSWHTEFSAYRTHYTTLTRQFCVRKCSTMKKKKNCFIWVQLYFNIFKTMKTCF